MNFIRDPSSLSASIKDMDAHQNLNGSSANNPLRMSLNSGKQKNGTQKGGKVIQSCLLRGGSALGNPSAG